MTLGNMVKGFTGAEIGLVLSGMGAIGGLFNKRPAKFKPHEFNYSSDPAIEASIQNIFAPQRAAITRRNVQDSRRSAGGAAARGFRGPGIIKALNETVNRNTNIERGNLSGLEAEQRQRSINARENLAVQNNINSFQSENASRAADNARLGAVFDTIGSVGGFIGSRALQREQQDFLRDILGLGKAGIDLTSAIQGSSRSQGATEARRNSQSTTAGFTPGGLSTANSNAGGGHLSAQKALANADRLIRSLDVNNITSGPAMSQGQQEYRLNRARAYQPRPSSNVGGGVQPSNGRLNEQQILDAIRNVPQGEFFPPPERNFNPNLPGSNQNQSAGPYYQQGDPNANNVRSGTLFNSDIQGTPQFSQTSGVEQSSIGDRAVDFTDPIGPPDRQTSSQIQQALRNSPGTGSLGPSLSPEQLGAINEMISNSPKSFGGSGKPVVNQVFNQQVNKARNLRSVARKNADGSTSTVKFASFEADGKHYVIPTIFQKNPNSSSSDPKDWINATDLNHAIQIARSRNEVFAFNSKEEAERFAKGAWKNKRGGR